MSKKLKMEQGKIYFLEYGGNTQVLGRFKDNATTQYNFYDLLHYWNGFENFQKGEGCYCIHSGITNLRRATKPEIHTLVRHEIENDCL